MSSNRLPLLLAILTLLMGGAALFAFVKLARARTDLALAQQQVLARDRVIIRQEQAAGRTRPTANPADLTAPYADTAKVAPPAAAVFADELGSLNGDNLSNLMKAGLPDDPEEFLAADLKKHAVELLGGKVTDVRILTERLALAAFAAPDLDGTAVLRYQVTGPGQVTWDVLDDGGSPK